MLDANLGDMRSQRLGALPDIEGFDYSWNMDAELILDEIADPPLDFAEPVPAGVYLPCGDLCDFVGCPLNGIWQFVIEDTWGGDNGTLYNWNIDFNPEIVPDVTTFSLSLVWKAIQLLDVGLSWNRRTTETPLSIHLTLRAPTTMTLRSPTTLDAGDTTVGL